jgi:hypothetical protein
MVGTPSTFYELYFKFYGIVVLRSGTSVTLQNEHSLLLYVVTNVSVKSIMAVFRVFSEEPGN